METMDEAHRADSTTERLCRDAERAIEAVLDNERRISNKQAIVLVEAQNVLRHTADHIVAVWD
jgi:hypothetical protein